MASENYRLKYVMQPIRDRTQAGLKLPPTPRAATSPAGRPGRHDPQKYTDRDGGAGENTGDNGQCVC
jgi:hypothetical protein